MPPVVLQLRGVSRVFAGGSEPIVAVDGIDAEFLAGTFTAILGRSGSGKSTLLHLCASLDRPSSGAVIVDGIDLATQDDDALARLRRTAIGLVFQFFNLMPQLSIEENALLPIVLERAPTGADLARLAALIERLGLSSRRTHRPERLSGGERQRAALARALMPSPRLLLADEPTGALDSTNATAIARWLRDLAHDDGVCVLAVTHDERVAALADSVLRLDDGRIVGIESRRGTTAP
ncbi:MAG: ABC transporter ATP-binding protein [Planctomycetes bacterium]|nr:ABC transporter ATP-binding protein [Planctomycetota bacterium]MCC7169692.1 ABC transporter ATP-binding protein [Planctomycetota bacterium]